MNELESIERLAGAARREPPPLVDVADAVLRRIGVRRRDPVPWVFGVFAAVSAAAAVVVCSLAVNLWLAAQDPFNEILDTMAVMR